MRNERGFTLVELMITIAVTMILLVAVYGAVTSVQRSSSGVERKVAAQRDAKPALDIMALEISMASYNPTRFPNATLWVLPPGVTGQCVNYGTATYKGIQEATANSITVEMDICGTTANPDSIVGPVGASGGQNEIIRYNYVTASQYITRSTNCGGAQAFLGDLPGNRRAVRVVNNTAGAGGTPIPVFQYFDGTGTQIAASGTDLAGNIPNIRRIDITLVVETEDVDPNTNQRRRLIYRTMVTPRNHAI